MNSKKKKQPELIGNLIDSILQERGYLLICKEWDVVAKWPVIVGEKIASVTECTRMEDGRLYVKVASSSWRNEIVFLKDEIIKKIKKETDCSSLYDIVFY
jgi:predicted nucleic acid-binding Zn ribbon protein